MTLGSDEIGDQVAQFWTLAQRARLSMRFGVEREALPGLIEDLRDIRLESAIPRVRLGASCIVAEYLRMVVAERMAAPGYGDIA